MRGNRGGKFVHAGACSFQRQEIAFECEAGSFKKGFPGDSPAATRTCHTTATVTQSSRRS